MNQPDLPLGLIPRDDALRRSLLRLAARAEGDGPAGLNMDLNTPDGRQAWQDMNCALRWIYDYAIDPGEPCRFP